MNIVNYNLKKKNNEILNKMKIQVIAKWIENCYYSHSKTDAGTTQRQCESEQLSIVL